MDTQGKRLNTAWNMHSALAQGDVEAKVHVLQMLVLDLLREVEALRRTQLEECQAKGISPKQSPYAHAYRETALLTHDSTGTSTGIRNLLERWEECEGTRHGGSLNELAMLARLGFSAQEIVQYIQEAEDYEMRT